MSSTALARYAQYRCKELIMIHSTLVPMPRAQPSPLDTKYPFGLLLAGAQETLMARMRRQLGDYCNRIIPEGFEDENGFHLNTPRSGRLPNCLGENI